MSLDLVDFLYHDRYQKAPLYLNVSALRCLVHDLILLIYPLKREGDFQNKVQLQDHLLSLIEKLRVSVVKVGGTEEQVTRFFNALPQIARDLDLDAEAAFEGDPAAKSIEEVILTYPGFYALCVYRMAHCLEKLNVPLIPRLLSEFAHEKTGIDIHPGATIGPRCFIDHGTGVVIGETSQIGENVKIYQGVTLGALSVKKRLQNQKRHPTIEDHVVLYANSTILGGHTVVGHHSVIGGNVWLTQSVPPHTTLLHKDEK